MNIGLARKIQRGKETFALIAYKGEKTTVPGDKRLFMLPKIFFIIDWVGTSDEVIRIRNGEEGRMMLSDMEFTDDMKEQTIKAVFNAEIKYNN